jgi:hypothetical protein
LSLTAVLGIKTHVSVPLLSALGETVPLIAKVTSSQVPSLESVTGAEMAVPAALTLALLPAKVGAVEPTYSVLAGRVVPDGPPV